jgi:hypothetical protein
MNNLFRMKKYNAAGDVKKLTAIVSPYLGVNAWNAYNPDPVTIRMDRKVVSDIAILVIWCDNKRPIIQHICTQEFFSTRETMRMMLQ